MGVKTRCSCAGLIGLCGKGTNPAKLHVATYSHPFGLVVVLTSDIRENKCFGVPRRQLTSLRTKTQRINYFRNFHT